MVVDTKTSNGTTPLQIARRGEHTQLVNFLEGTLAAASEMAQKPRQLARQPISLDGDSEFVQDVEQQQV